MTTIFCNNLLINDTIKYLLHLYTRTFQNVFNTKKHKKLTHLLIIIINNIIIKKTTTTTTKKRVSHEPIRFYYVMLCNTIKSFLFIYYTFSSSIKGGLNV